jgi:hypothetical protein
MNQFPVKLSPTRRPWSAPAHLTVALWVCFFFALIALGQEPEHPLKPPDRSSPHAALKTFLEAGDAVGAF